MVDLLTLQRRIQPPMEKGEMAVLRLKLTLDQPDFVLQTIAKSVRPDFEAVLRDIEPVVIPDALPGVDSGTLSMLKVGLIAHNAATREMLRAIDAILEDDRAGFHQHWMTAAKLYRTAVDAFDLA